MAREKPSTFGVGSGCEEAEGSPVDIKARQGHGLHLRAARRLQQYERLHQAFSERVPVLWDRRRRSVPVKDDDTGTQRADRRQAPPVSWVALGFVVVNRPYK